MASVALVLLGKRGSGGREVSTSNLLLVDCRLVLLLDNRPDLLERGGLEVGSDDGGLDEELVAALGRRRGLFLHGLEKDLNLDSLAGLDTARVGTNAVLLGCGGLDLEGDGLIVGVSNGQGSLDELSERACRRCRLAVGGKRVRRSQVSELCGELVEGQMYESVNLRGKPSWTWGLSLFERKV